MKFLVSWTSQDVVGFATVTATTPDISAAQHNNLKPSFPAHSALLCCGSTAAFQGQEGASRSTGHRTAAEKQRKTSEEVLVRSEGTEASCDLAATLSYGLNRVPSKFTYRSLIPSWYLEVGLWDVIRFRRGHDSGALRWHWCSYKRHQTGSPPLSSPPLPSLPLSSLLFSLFLTPNGDTVRRPQPSAT